MNNSTGIYLIAVQTEGLPLYYVGQTNCMRKRLAGHLSTLGSGSHRNARLQAAFDKYGRGSFRFEVLEECSSDRLDVAEQWWLDEMHGSDRCLNIASDAQSTAKGVDFSAERRKKIGDAKRGKSLSDAVRLKMSEAHRGRKLSAEHREAIAAGKRGDKNPAFGKPLSAEWREAVSAGLKNSKLAQARRCRVEMVDELGVTVKSYESMSAVAVDGFSPDKVSMVCSGRRPVHGGYRWRKVAPDEA